MQATIHFVSRLEKYQTFCRVSSAIILCIKEPVFRKKTFSYYKIYDRHSIAESLGILQFAAIEKNISRFVPLCRISSCLLHMCIPLFMFNKITSCLFARFPLNTIFVADDKVQNKATFSVLEFISSI